MDSPSFRFSWLAWALCGALAGAGCPAFAQAQTPLNLDTNPSFDFGPPPTTDPLFAPETLGLPGGTPAFNSVAVLNAAAQVVAGQFPPGLEVFVAYWGNPGYALLGGTGQPPLPLAAGSSLSLAGAFRSAGARGQTLTAIPGRTASAMYAEGTEVTVDGARYFLPGPRMFVSPLVLDLDDDGLLGASRGQWLPHPAQLTGPYAAFDMDGDGFKDVTEWVGAGDGLLVTTSLPASGRDLVGTAGGWRDGFEHLRLRADRDGDGAVSGLELDGLYVWQDGNTNGIAEPGEVVSASSLGIAWISVEHDGRFVGRFGKSNGASGTLWDWWPNYALALRRSATPADGGTPAFVPFPNHYVPAVEGDNVAPKTSKAAGLKEKVHFPIAALAGAGIDVASFRLALLADGGRALIGYDTAEVEGGGGRIGQRLWRIRPRLNAGGGFDVLVLMVPFEAVYQLASDPAGRVVFVLGDHGARLAVADFERGTVTPAAGLELQSVGLRASGLAGWSDLFWFSAWQLDERGEVTDERVWALTPWGFWGGLSLEALRTEFGQLRSFFVTGPTSGYFAVPDPAGGGEAMHALRVMALVPSLAGNGPAGPAAGSVLASGLDRVVDRADSFGGLHATANGVAYTKRDGSRFTFAAGHGDTNVTVLDTGDTPVFYPFLSAGGSAIATTLSPAAGTITYWLASNETAAATGPSPVVPLLTTQPGQGKIARGAFAHYGANGIDLLPLPDPAPAPSPDTIWQYRLLPGSQLSDDCPVCARPTILQPMQGTFRLRRVRENPLFSTYAVENIAFTAGGPAGRRYQVVGRGAYQVGGEVGLFQEMFLEVRIDNGVTNTLCYFTNATPTVDRGWPMLQITLNQTNGTPLQTFTLELNAAPLRQIWFSTASGMTPADWLPPTNHLSAGDLLSSAGRVVKRNEDLTRHLGLMPVPPDLGLDAVDLLPDGSMGFSLEADAFSETLGLLQHGDLLSDRGRIVARNQDLTRAFGLRPPVPDVGLDAVQVRSDGEILFSIEKPILSGANGELGPGDLLSDRGLVVKRHAELLARFHPPLTAGLVAHDYGLDAVYVWPSGEVWFSLEEGFPDGRLGPIQPGDLLSDQGYIVFRNLDLVAAFAPLEDLADFGLDALGILSGATPRLDLVRAADGLVLTWEAPLAVLQAADGITGPWRDVSPLETPGTYVVPSPSGAQFFRLREP